MKPLPARYILSSTQGVCDLSETDNLRDVLIQSMAESLEYDWDAHKEDLTTAGAAPITDTDAVDANTADTGTDAVETSEAVATVLLRICFLKGQR